MFRYLIERVWWLFFTILYYILKLVIPKPKILGFENLEKLEKPFIFISNHALSWAPLVTYLFLPFKVYPWVIYYITEKYFCRKHLENDFVRKELKLCSPFSEILSFILELIVIPLMKYINAIPVYQKSKKLIYTFNLSLDFLKSGKNIIIFPEEESNLVDYQFVNIFKTGFVKLALLYYENTKRKVYLVPVSVNKRLNFIKFGKPISLNQNRNFNEEKKRIIKYLQNQIIKNMEP